MLTDSCSNLFGVVLHSGAMLAQERWQVLDTASFIPINMEERCASQLPGQGPQLELTVLVNDLYHPIGNSHHCKHYSALE